MRTFWLNPADNEPEISSSSEHVFIALSQRSEMIMGFHEYTYQDREYIIRAMNTKHAQSQLVTKPYTYGSSWPALGCTYNCTLSF